VEQLAEFFVSMPAQAFYPPRVEGCLKSGDGCAEADLLRHCLMVIVGAVVPRGVKYFGLS
jgi:hypothetical protein